VVTTPSAFFTPILKKVTKVKRLQKWKQHLV